MRSLIHTVPKELNLPRLLPVHTLRIDQKQLRLLPALLLLLIRRQRFIDTDIPLTVDDPLRGRLHKRSFRIADADHPPACGCSDPYLAVLCRLHLRLPSSRFTKPDTLRYIYIHLGRIVLCRL